VVPLAADYDGTAPFPDADLLPETAGGRFQTGVTVAIGESWHNMHHSDPTCVRHGADPHEVDMSAGLIRLFERLGWATGVHWPDPDRLAARRRDAGQDQAQQVLQRAGR
jgi:fatty-acid desaturase